MNLQDLPLRGGLIGVEREALRCDAQGHLARTPHPEALGKALTHPRITVDYGEALLELVTGAKDSVEKVYEELTQLHRFCAQNLAPGESLWPASMPCVLPPEEDIALADFGRSNTAQMRHLYRRGLALRYGKSMQMIAGIHFNYSPPEALFPVLAAAAGEEDGQDFRNKRFMGMIRRIQSLSWLICYSYGASPAVDVSFEPGRRQLSLQGDESLLWQHACTLRMSQLGYQNKVDFAISLDDLESYSRDLMAAVLTPAPHYEYLGLRDARGQLQQISTHILQIENEYYSAVRPKQPQKRGELPSVALRERGIAYVELRVLDVNPYAPCGIDLAQMRTLEALLLWCFLNPAPPLSTAAWNELNHNRLRAACRGLHPATELFEDGRARPIGEWARQLWREILAVAEALGSEHGAAVAALLDAEPLAVRIQGALRHRSHREWALQRIQEHQSCWQEALPAELEQALRAEVEQSRRDFAALEAQSSPPFAEYLRHYFDAIRPGSA